ncbi:hypothetical protein JL720_12879 [Aureococcus anophagefferens]|nr:hypothetical protein JL720_12879 [Aureococcus anophagefferens]
MAELADRLAQVTLSPLAAVDSLFEDDATTSTLRDRFTAHLTAAGVVTEALPVLDARSYASGAAPPQSLVRLVGMVQDMGNNEIYLPSMFSSRAGRACTMFRDSAPEGAVMDDEPSFDDRRPLYVVAAPASSPGRVRARRGGARGVGGQAARSDDGGGDDDVDPGRRRPRRAPRPWTPRGRGAGGGARLECVVRVYGPSVPKLNDLVEFVGELEDDSAWDPPLSRVARLHCVSYRVLDEWYPRGGGADMSPSDAEAARADVLDVFAAALGGDRAAAEYCLYALCAKTEKRHATKARPRARLRRGRGRSAAIDDGAASDLEDQYLAARATGKISQATAEKRLDIRRAAARPGAPGARARIRSARAPASATQGPLGSTVTSSTSEAGGPRDPHSVEQQSAEVINAVLGNIFSTRRPRDVCAGAASAFKSIAKGVALGFAALIAAPESKALAKKKMLRGVAAGVGAGLCGALLLPLTGVVVGVGQICPGCWNTPSALYHAAVGDLEWDKESREWKEREAYVLSAEAEVVRREAASEGLDRFEAYVGELALAQISSTLTKRGGAAEAASKAIVTSEETGGARADGELGGAIAQGLAEVRGQHGVKQRGREVGLATTLAAALEPFVRRRGRVRAWCAAEAGELAVADGDEALTKGALILALARGYGLAADEWLGRHDGVLGIAGVVSSYKNDAFKNLAYANAARAGAQGLYAAKKLSELVPVDKEAAHIEEVEVEVDDETPAARSDLAALGVGKLKALAKRHRVDVSGCVEKAHLVDALLAAHVPLPREAKPAEAAPSAADARKKQTEEAYKASMPIFLEAMLRVDRRAKSRPKPPADAAAATGDEGEAKDESARRIEHAVNVTMAAAMGQEPSEDHGKHMPPPGGDAF